MTLLKVVCTLVAFSFCISKCFGAAFMVEATVGKPLELSVGNDSSEPLIWKRKVMVDGKEVTQYLFPCSCNIGGGWTTDGIHFFGSGAEAQWNGKLRIAHYSPDDAGLYMVVNEKVEQGLPASLIQVVTKKEKSSLSSFISKVRGRLS